MEEIPVCTGVFIRVRPRMIVDHLGDLGGAGPFFDRHRGVGDPRRKPDHLTKQLSLTCLAAASRKSPVAVARMPAQRARVPRPLRAGEASVLKVQGYANGECRDGRVGVGVPQLGPYVGTVL